jgi:hypothetical protein
MRAAVVLAWLRVFGDGVPERGVVVSTPPRWTPHP